MSWGDHPGDAEGLWQITQALLDRNTIERAKLAEMRAHRTGVASRWCDQHNRRATTTHNLAEAAWHTADTLTAKALGEDIQ